MRSTWGLVGLYRCSRGMLEGLVPGYLDLETRICTLRGSLALGWGE